MEIRPLEDTADVREVVRVNARAWQEAFDDVVPDEVLEGLDPELTDSEAEGALVARQGEREAFLVAEEDGTVVGYAYLRWGEETKEFVGPDEAGLKELYVHPGHWNRGVGTELLDRGLERLPDEVDRVRLETLADNDVGRGFYESRGFERTGTTRVEVADREFPAVIYTLEC